MRCIFDLAGLTDRAVGQEGLWTRRQALDHGATQDAVRYRVRSGQWLDHGHGVFGMPGTPWSHRRHLWRAHLVAGAGSIVSHEAAAVVRGVRGFGGTPVVVIRDHGAWSRLAGVTVHQIDDCVKRHRGMVDGLPVTTLDRTLLDLAAVCGRARIEKAVEEELARGRVSLGSLATVLNEVARPGKPGVGRLHAVLDRQTGGRPSASRLEHLMEGLLRRINGLQYESEVPLPGRGDMPGRVDFAIPACRVIIEVDGRRWHERRSDMVRDRDRDNSAASAGWITLRFMWEHLADDSDGVRRIIEATCGERRPTRFSMAEAELKTT